MGCTRVETKTWDFRRRWRSYHSLWSSRTTRCDLVRTMQHYTLIMGSDLGSNLGELTDRGRETTLALGERLRHLYVDQLGFMPKQINDANMIYLRATPIPRALESLQQTFWGMYPSSSRGGHFPPPTMIIRNPADETLYPNDGNCRRFSQLSRAFAERTANRCECVTTLQPSNLFLLSYCLHPDATVRESYQRNGLP